MLRLRNNSTSFLLWLMLVLPMEALTNEGQLNARFLPIVGNPDALDFALEDRFVDLKNLLFLIFGNLSKNTIIKEN